MSVGHLLAWLAVAFFVIAALDYGAGAGIVTPDTWLVPGGLAAFVLAWLTDDWRPWRH